MAFFDNVGKKLTQAGQNAVQKTKDIADITRINSAISEEEKNLDNIYCDLGRIYFSLHSEDCEEKLKPIVMSVKEAEMRILQYRYQVQDIKGIIRCEACGREIPANSAFCSGCGTPVVRKIPEGMVQCTACGQFLQKGTRFCTFCGRELAEAPMSAPVTASTLPVQAPAEVKTELRCQNCKSIITDDMEFCTECGTKIK